MNYFLLFILLFVHLGSTAQTEPVAPRFFEIPDWGYGVLLDSLDSATYKSGALKMTLTSEVEGGLGHRDVTGTFGFNFNDKSAEELWKVFFDYKKFPGEGQVAARDTTHNLSGYRCYIQSQTPEDGSWDGEVCRAVCTCESAYLQFQLLGMNEDGIPEMIALLDRSSLENFTEQRQTVLNEVDAAVRELFQRVSQRESIDDFLISYEEMVDLMTQAGQFVPPSDHAIMKDMIGQWNDASREMAESIAEMDSIPMVDVAYVGSEEMYPGMEMLGIVLTFLDDGAIKQWGWTMMRWEDEFRLVKPRKEPE